MLPEWLIQFCRKNWRVMKGAPVAFFGLLAIGIGLAIIVSWLAMEWRYRAQLENKDAGIEDGQPDDGVPSRALSASAYR